jgi:hypothetical protein
VRVESDLSSSGFPASFFTNDPDEQDNGDSPTSFDFKLLDPEKVRKGSIYSQDSDSVETRLYTLESSKYSAHSISFDTYRNASKTPAMVALPTTRSASAAIIKALKKGNDAPKNVTPRDKELQLVQPPPEAHLRTPRKGTRSRKETSSLSTQATGVSMNSSSHAVISFARKDPVLSANARTIATSTIYSKHGPSPVDTVMPHENNPSIDLGTAGKFIPQPDSYGRI